MTQVELTTPPAVSRSVSRRRCFSNSVNDLFFSEPRCGVALVSDGRPGPPDLERGSPSCPPSTNDNPPTDRGGADSETESDTDDP